VARILVIEDEPDIQVLVRYHLEKDQHNVTVVASGDDGLHEARRQAYDLVLLDLMLPDKDGLEVCRQLRARDATARVPIIMVTAKGEESDVVVGLGMGADDYVTKPFRIKELMARVRARLLRAREMGDNGQQQRVEISGLVVDPIRHQAQIDGTLVNLTLTEFRLLHYLATHPGVAYGRYALLDNIGGDGDAVTDRTIDVHIRNLRDKIRPYDTYIETVRGVGYRFADEAIT
jgi:DNA-binding response OmpR family regulator